MKRRGAGRGFFVQDEMTSPSSDATDDASVSSYDDGGSSYYMPAIVNEPMDQRLYVINRAGSGEASYMQVSPDRQHIVSYRLRTEIWPPLVDLTHFGIAVVNNVLYIIGGFNRRHALHLNRMIRYDPSESTWSSCASMSVARAKFGVCTSGGKIYVIGGEKSDGRVTGSCEMYDPGTDTWSKAGMLPHPRANPICAAHRKEIYCSGGYFGNSSHKNLWLYEGYRWGEVDEDYPLVLPACMDRCAVTVHDNTIYFMGGVVAKTKDKAERPKFHTERRVFSYTTCISAMAKHNGGSASRSSDLVSPWNLKMSPMHYARHSAGAVALGHKIYVVGGMALETGQQIRIAERLDTRTGMWEEDFNFRKGDVSNVICTLLAVPKIPVSKRKNAYRLKWVMW